jgi:hypothetical protein
MGSERAYDDWAAWTLNNPNWNIEFPVVVGFEDFLSFKIGDCIYSSSTFYGITLTGILSVFF